MAQDLVTAIDIGTESVKVVAVRQRRDVLEVVGAGMAVLTEAERSAENPAAAIGQVLHRVIHKHSIPLGHIVISLAGRGSMVRYLSVPMVPQWKLALLMGFEVEEQMGATGSDTEVAYDYRILSLPDFEEGMFPILLALAQVPVIDTRLAICRQGTRRRAEEVDLQALGAFNLFRETSQCLDEETSILLDIGANETHICLQRGPSLFFTRTISFGGRQITSRIQQALDLLGPEAEEYKRTRAQIVPADEEDLFEEEILAGSRVSYAEVKGLAGAVESSLHFFHGQYNRRDIQPEKIYLTGGGSRLKGIEDALHRASGYVVERLDPNSAVRPASASAEAALAGEGVQHFSGILGLACSRLTNGFGVSLLPPHVKKKREFWRSTVYTCYSGVLAGVLLLLLLLGGCPFYGGGCRDASYYAERNAKWQEHLKLADAAHKEVTELSEVNARLAKQLTALEVRQQSGPALFVALRSLQHKTPKYVFYTELRTQEIPKETADRAEARAGARRPGRPARPALQDGTTFQTNRFVELKGYIVGQKKAQDAIARLVELEQSLNKSEVFSQVRIQRQENLLASEPRVEQAYAARLFKSGRTLRVKPPEGVVLSFVLRCGIAEVNVDRM